MSIHRYVNVNPENKRESDCVCRAISLALRIPYRIVERMLEENGDVHICDDLTKMCYSKLLSDRFDLPSYSGRGRTVGEIASIYENRILLIRIDGHLTCSVYGTVCDIWDCTNEVCDTFWIAE